MGRAVTLTVCASSNNAVFSAKQRGVEDRLGKDPGDGGRRSKQYDVSSALFLRSQSSSAS